MNLFPSSSRPRAFGVMESRCLEAKPRFGASLVHYAHDCETGLITGDSLRPSPLSEQINLLTLRSSNLMLPILSNPTLMHNGFFSEMDTSNLYKVRRMGVFK